MRPTKKYFLGFNFIILIFACNHSNKLYPLQFNGLYSIKTATIIANGIEYEFKNYLIFYPDSSVFSVTIGDLEKAKEFFELNAPFKGIGKVRFQNDSLKFEIQNELGITTYEGYFVDSKTIRLTTHHLIDGKINSRHDYELRFYSGDYKFEPFNK